MDPGHAGGDRRPSLLGARLCGALGAYDRRRVAEMADRLGPGLRQAHADRHSVLWLDREPVRWAAGDASGLAWSEGPRRSVEVDSWRAAATSLNAAGLVAEGGRRFVHASVSGLAPVYWLEDGRATYFASRIDPLVSTARGTLKPDWHAWTSILALGYPLASHTPFAEVRALQPLDRLERRRRGSTVVGDPWPWAEAEPRPVEEAAEALIEELRRALSSVGEEGILFPLSGGGDSRLLLALLAEQRPPALSAWTLPGTWGYEDDERLAARVAAALGVAHTVLPLDLSGYWRDAEAIAERTDFQQALEWAWFMPLARHLGSRRGTTVDGLAGDILVRGMFIRPRTIAASASDPGVQETLWRRLTTGRQPHRILRARLARAVRATAREQLVREVEAVGDHPHFPSLVVYRHRTRRGMSAGALGALAPVLPTLAPYADDGVARAALSAPPEALLRGGFHRRLIERAAPQLGRIPVTSYGFTRSKQAIALRQYGEEALGGHLALLRACPLRRWLRPPIREAVEAGDLPRLRELCPDSRDLNGLSLLTLWTRRYGDRLADWDPRELIGSR